MKVKRRTNTIEVQRLTSKLMKHGIRVFIEHVGGGPRDPQFVISFDRLIVPGVWGNKHSFDKKVYKEETEDAYVKTVEDLYQKEIVEQRNRNNDIN